MSIRSNFADVGARITELGRQGPYVAARALTLSLKDGQGAFKGEMETKLDRPTSYALNGTFVKGANKNNLEGRLWVKDNPFGKGTPADRFLLPHVFGGGRGHKGMERMLQGAGMMPQGWYAVPAAGAQLDGNGNMKRGQIRQMLSQLKVQRGAGHESRASGSTRSNRTIARQGVTYFALPEGNRGLPPGIYLKRRFGHGTAVRPVLVFVDQVQYQKLLEFFEVTTNTVTRRFPVHFAEGLAQVQAEVGLR
ncbi:hypothetical protein QPK31_02765 [Massilia sp. YIM B02769]|uniref:hypothetical protein n=1 Tax=Massilia sp. YIM B02769 TaxID=3050129 RepID=UPI0025B6D1E0|nr:hypothetical protein [Massilia sp. YIM B02769]MDN4057139.1 hypothetical protein [Massilia sp. YIM B02769]